MFRLLFILTLAFAASVWIEPRWNGESKELILRLRQPNEIFAVVREQARALGKRVVEAAGDQIEPAPVSAPGPVERKLADELTADDRRALDRLVDRRLRESERGAASRTD